MSKLLENPKALCNIVRRIAVEAGHIILPYFDGFEDRKLAIKGDGSPVTVADQAAEDYITKALYDLLPDVPVIGEEAVSAGNIPNLSSAEYFWLVDPLDGTKEFIKDSPDFTVNIALIRKTIPVIGVVYAPALGELYAGHGEGTAIRWIEDTDKEKSIRVRKPPAKGLTAIFSRSHNPMKRTEKYLEEFKIAKVMRRGSSLKMCLIAAGKADIYPRFGPTSEWDTAASDIILRSAGRGVIETFDGHALSYGHSDRNFLNPEFVAHSGVL